MLTFCCTFLNLTPPQCCLLLFCFLSLCIRFCHLLRVRLNLQLACKLDLVSSDHTKKTSSLLLNIKGVLHCSAEWPTQLFCYHSSSGLCWWLLFFFLRCLQWWMVSPILYQLWLTASTSHPMVLNISQKIDVRKYIEYWGFLSLSQVWLKVGVAADAEVMTVGYQ